MKECRDIFFYGDDWRMSVEGIYLQINTRIYIWVWDNVKAVSPHKAVKPILAEHIRNL